MPPYDDMKPLFGMGVGVTDPLLGGLCRKKAVAGVGGVGVGGGEEATDAPREANVGLSLR